jgi:type IV pilus assembly protein PilF
MIHYTYRILAAILVTGLVACSSTGPTKEADRQKLRRAAATNVQLGIEYMRDGNMEVAMNKLEKAIDQDPDLPAAYDALAVLYERLGEDELARKNFKKALKLNPDNSRTHNNYGNFLCLQGDYIEAEEHFNAAASNPLYEQIPGALTNAGICANRVPDPEKAEDYFRRALEYDPQYTPALQLMAKTRFEQGNYMGARGYLQRYEAIAPYNPEILWLGVRTETALGNKDAAARYALLLQNNFPDSQQASLLQEWENERRTNRQ